MGIQNSWAVLLALVLVCPPPAAQGREWVGRWISSPAAATNFYSDQPHSLLRGKFTVNGAVKSATLHCVGLGYAEVFLDGQPVRSSALDPPLSNFSRRVLYSTIDVTPLLQAGGEHVLGVSLGNGWWNPLPLRFWGRFNLQESLTTGLPMFIADLEILQVDGSQHTIGSSTSWVAGQGWLLHNDIYLGVKHDQARKNALAGWAEVGFDDAAWSPTILAPNASRVGTLEPQAVEPIERIQRLVGTQLRCREAIRVIDLGVNHAGVPVFEVFGPLPANTVLAVRYGELLLPNSSVNTLTSTAGQIKSPGTGGPGAPDVAEQRDVFITDSILAGSSVTFEPQFTWHGFRYAQLEGLPCTNDLRTHGWTLRTAVRTTASFAASNGLLNEIWAMSLRSHESNMMSVQSDCPHRERFGYGGDLLGTAETALHAWDVSRFYSKRVVDFVDSQTPEGGFTETAPNAGMADGGLGGGAGPIGWGSVVPQLQAWLYRYYNDTATLHANYEATARWIAFLQRAPKERVEGGLGDWMPTEQVPVQLSGRAFMVMNFRAWADINRAVGKPDVAAEFDQQAQDQVDLFNKEFFNESSGIYALPGGPATQVGQALALYFKMVPLGYESKVREVLRDHIASNPHLLAGLFGVKWVLLALSEAGMNDLAYKMVTQVDFPSYGYMLKNNATTLWESWFFSNNTFSHNHEMFSSVVVWFIQSLAGIRQATDSVGFSSLVLSPQPPSKTDLAINGTFHSMRGRIDSNWTCSAGTFSWTVRVPADTKAVAVVPGGSPVSVSEGVHVFKGSCPNQDEIFIL